MSDSKDSEERVKLAEELIKASPGWKEFCKEYRKSKGISFPLEDLESKKGNATEPENTPVPPTPAQAKAFSPES